MKKRNLTHGANALAPLPETQTAGQASNLIAFPSAAKAEKAALVQHRLEYLPLSKLYESGTNPRKHFSERELADLTESVRINGVRTPLGVRPRPIEGTELEYEIVGGARRFRAATRAGLETVPVVLQELTDNQVIEMQLIENLQREDLHPLEEAAGYQQLIDLGYTPEQVAAKIGKTSDGRDRLSYLYCSVKLLALTEEAQRDFLAEKFTKGHAVQIARLQPGDQALCLSALSGGQIRSVRELGRYIETNVHLDLSAAPFPIDSETVLPAAGACTVCQKRVGGNPLLFADLGESKGNTCTDRACFNAKIDALVEVRVEEAKVKGKDLLKVSMAYFCEQKAPEGVLPRGQYMVIEKKTERCPSAQDAVIAAGDKTGSIITVCADKGCKMHFPKSAGAAVERPAARTPAVAKRESAQAPEARRQKEAARIRVEVEKQVRLAVVKTVGPKLARADVELLATAAFQHMGYVGMEDLAAEYQLTAKSGRLSETLTTHAMSLPDTELNRMLVNAVLLEREPMATGDQALLKARKIDVKAIQKQVEKAFAKPEAKPDQKPAKSQTAAKKPNKPTAKAAKK